MEIYNILLWLYYVGLCANNQNDRNVVTTALLLLLLIKLDPSRNLGSSRAVRDCSGHLHLSGAYLLTQLQARGLSNTQNYA